MNKTTSIIPVKAAYKIHRKDSKEIYKGFSFKHLSDATQYYVHPDNQSFRGTTTLCQPIGEALILFSDLLKSIREDNPIGDFFSADFGGSHIKNYAEIYIPDEYHDAGVLPERISKLRILREGASIKFAAYDSKERYLPDYIDPDKIEYRHILPVILIMLAKEYEDNPVWAKMAIKFSENPACDDFVNIHEDFYQAHKAHSIKIAYGAIDSSEAAGLKSGGKAYKTLCENKSRLNKNEDVSIIKFNKNEFLPERLSLIPDLSEEFELPEELKSLSCAVTMGDAPAVLLHGPAGTGKTISCKLICREIGLPIMETINCTENLDEFVLGKFIPRDDKIVFYESYVTKAIREGGAVVFEEINFAKPQYLAFLNSLLDDNGFVRLDNGEVVKRHKNFRFFATMNIGYFGTRELNQALYNRFSAVVEIGALPDSAITKMLKARVPECEPYIKKMLDVYHKIKAKIDAEESDYVISPRNLENWAKMAKYEGYLKAAEKTLISAVRCDRALEEAIRGIILLYRWTE